jgi:hypothetical protein
VNSILAHPHPPISHSTHRLPASQLSSVADLTKKLYQNLDIHNSAELGAKIWLGEMHLRANLRQQNCGGQDAPGRRPPRPPGDLPTGERLFGAVIPMGDCTPKLARFGLSGSDCPI